MEAQDSAIAELLRNEFDVVVKEPDRDAKRRGVLAFCNIVIREQRGPVVAAKFLAVEIQSSDDGVALKAFEILDSCVRRCGPRFQAEVGKFRFLNEIVKLVSPRHLGNKTTEKVKVKATELLYIWTQLLPDEPKIREAYDMLKEQKLIGEDVDVPLCTNVGPDGDDVNGGESPHVDQDSASAAGRRNDDIFRNDERSQRLKKLLQSKNPHDLLEANKLIKRIVSENEQKQAKASWRASELGRVHTIVGVLSDMLSAFQPSTPSSDEEKETLKQLYSSCKELRTGLPKIADQTDDGDKDALVNIVKASEDLDMVIKDYEFFVEGRGSPSARRKPAKPSGDAGSLLDLDLLSLSSAGLESPEGPCDSKEPQDQSQLLEEVFGRASAQQKPITQGRVHSSQEDYLLLSDFASGASVLNPSTSNVRPVEGPTPIMNSGHATSKYVFEVAKTSVPETKPSAASSIFEDIEKMARERLPLNKPNAPTAVGDDDTVPNVPNKAETNVKGVPVVAQKTAVSEPAPASGDAGVAGDATPPMAGFDEITLSLDDVMPSEKEPQVLVSTNDVFLTLASGVVPARPDLSVGVLTFANKSKSPVTDYVFKAVFTPKSIPARLLPASDTRLAPCRPFVPPPVITQLLIVSNSAKVPLSMKFVLCFTKDDDLESERGTIDRLLL